MHAPELLARGGAVVVVVDHQGYSVQEDYLHMAVMTVSSSNLGRTLNLHFQIEQGASYSVPPSCFSF